MEGMGAPAIGLSRKGLIDFNTSVAGEGPHAQRHAGPFNLPTTCFRRVYYARPIISDLKGAL